MICVMNHRLETDQIYDVPISANISFLLYSNPSRDSPDVISFKHAFMEFLRRISHRRYLSSISRGRSIHRRGTQQVGTRNIDSDTKIDSYFGDISVHDRRRAYIQVLHRPSTPTHILTKILIYARLGVMSVVCVLRRDSFRIRILD